MAKENKSGYLELFLGPMFSVKHPVLLKYINSRVLWTKSISY